MPSYNIATEGLQQAEEVLLTIILSLCSNKLTCPWELVMAEPVHAILYNMANPESRSSWERSNNNRNPVALAYSEEDVPGAQWVMPKPLRTDKVVEFLNNLSTWIEQPPSPSSIEEPPINGDTRLTLLKTRLAKLVSQQDLLSRSREMKVIFSGSVGSGKTTAIHTLSETPPIRTEVMASQEPAMRKPTTTVGLDYGELTLPDGQKLCLYGTPGQKRFDFMCKIICRGGLGLVLLVDNLAINPLSTLDYYLDFYSTFIHETAVVIGVTHMDRSPFPRIERYVEHLRLRGDPWPVFSVDARSKEDITTLTEGLVTMLDHVGEVETC